MCFFILIYSESFRAPHPSRGKTKSVIYFLRKMQSFVTTENHSSARWRNISGLDSRLSDQKMLNKMIKNCIGSRKKKFQKQKKTFSIKWGFLNRTSNWIRKNGKIQYKNVLTRVKYKGLHILCLLERYGTLLLLDIYDCSNWKIIS